MDTNNQSHPRILSRAYWQEAARQCTVTKMLVFAALIVALRVVVKLFKIPLAADLSLSFDCYVNSLGAVVYGPVLGLLVGAVSDTLGCILIPSALGPYFFPFIFVEMSSSFLFGLFFWRRNISIPRVLLAKFTVNFICNIILNTLIIKWQYAFLGTDKAYPFVNLVRIVKNLVLFPFEAVLICVVFGATLPVLGKLRVLPGEQRPLQITKRNVIAIVILTLVSVGLVVFYWLFLKEFISQNNVKLW